MSTIGGIEIFPIISFLIFFIFFIGLFIWVLRMKKKDMDDLANMPLNDNETTNNQITDNN